MFVFFQAEDDIRDLVRSRGRGDVYKRQIEQTAVYNMFDHNFIDYTVTPYNMNATTRITATNCLLHKNAKGRSYDCLLYTSDAADERSSVDLGGRRIIKKKNKKNI